MSKEGLVIQGVLTKVTTTVDGGWRISFDLGEDQTLATTQLSLLRDQLLNIVIVQLEG